MVKNSKIIITFLFLLCFVSNTFYSQEKFDKDLNFNKITYFSNRNIDSLLFYSKKMQESKNPCNAYQGITTEALFYYKKNEYSESEKLVKLVISKLKYKNEECHKKNQISALNRLFWIKKRQEKYTEAYNYILLTDSIISCLKKDSYSYRYKLSTKTNMALIKSELKLYNQSKTILLDIVNDFEEKEVYDSQKPTNNFLLQKASIFNMIGDNYVSLYEEHLNIKYIDSADIFYLKAHLESKKIDPPLEKSNMYYDFRKIKLLIKTGKAKEALRILQKYSAKNDELLEYHLSYFKAILYNELNVIDSSLFYSKNYIKLKKKVGSKSNLLKFYAILSNAYNSKKEIDSAYKYSNLTLKELEIIKSEDNKMFNKIYLEDHNKAKELNNKIIKTKSESNSKFRIIILVLILIVFSFIYLLRKKQLKLIPLKKEYNIDSKLEKEILNGIKELETSNDFLHPEFNIGVFAKKLNTNTSYLSYLINTTKKQSFKKYITELRIEYLIKKLKEERKFRNYTIKSLAEEIGYTNASAFTRTFKKYKGITPSEYIKSIS